MNATPTRRIGYLLATGLCLLIALGLLFFFKTRRNVATTTYSHLAGGIQWKRVDYYESYHRPFGLKGLAVEIRQAVENRSLPRWRSRVEIRYVLLEPVTGDVPEVLARLHTFLKQSFTAGIQQPLPDVDGSAGELITAARKQFADRRRLAPNQGEYLDFRTMKVLHESPRHIVLQVQLERAVSGLGPNQGSTTMVFEKGTGRAAPFPESWNPLVDPPIEAILDRISRAAPGPLVPVR